MSPGPGPQPHTREQALTLCPPRSLPLPEPWRGLRDEALSRLSGIPGCVFVHATGFIGGNRTRDGALEMARRTLEQRGADEAPPGTGTPKGTL